VERADGVFGCRLSRARYRNISGWDRRNKQNVHSSYGVACRLSGITVRVKFRYGSLEKRAAEGRVHALLMS